MRRLIAALGVVGIASALVLVPLPATAVEPLPPPVAELPDLPARVLRAITNSPIANQTFLMQQALIEFGKTAPKPAVGSVPLTAPKLITPPQALSRAAGGVMTLAMLGWAITANGTISSVAALNNDPFENVYCSQPAWYQSVTMFVSLSIGPDCTSLIEGPNADKPVTEVMSMGGWPARNFVGASPTFALYTAICGPVGYNVPTGHIVVVKWMNGSQGTANYVTSAGVLNANCGAASPRMFSTLSAPSGTSYPAVDWMELRTSGGAVVERSVKQAPNPTRRADCRMTAADGTVKTGLGDFFNEADGIPLSAEGLGCAQAYEDFVSEPGRGPGFVPDRIEVGSTDDVGTRTIVSDQETPEYTEAERESMVPNGNGQGLRLEKVVGTVVGNCMTWEVDCAGWWTATSSGTQPTTGETTYRCTYAGRSLALAECGVYRQTFDVKTANPTITDPQTGQQTPWVTAPATSGGNSTSPATGPTPGGECMASWPSAPDPLSWVFWPVRCALVWAFVPRQTVVDSFVTTTGVRFAQSTVGKYGAAVSGLGVAFTELGDGSCGGIPLNFPVPGADGQVTTKAVMFLPSCPGDFFGAIAPVFKALTGLAIVLMGLFGVRDQLDRFVNN